MASPKIEHKPRGKLRKKPHPLRGARWVGDYLVPDDDDIPGDFKNIILFWRAKYWRIGIAPDEKGIRASLLDLTNISDDDAVVVIKDSLLDPGTYCRLRYGAFLLFKREKHNAPPFPFVASMWLSTPEKIRESAKLVLESLPKDKGGRPEIRGIDEMFASAIASYWTRSKGKKPPSTTGANNEFTEFARDMFARAGRKLPDLDKVLRVGLRLSSGSEKRRYSKMKMRTSFGDQALQKPDIFLRWCGYPIK